MTCKLNKTQIQRILDLFGPNGERWTTQAHARTAAGNRIHADSVDAVCWCLEGACIKLNLPTGAEAFDQNAPFWNDRHSFPEVRSMLLKSAANN